MIYVIMNNTDITEARVADCQETSISSLRHSISGADRVVLKYKGAEPSWVSSLGLTKYSVSEIAGEMAGSDWKEEE